MDKLKPVLEQKFWIFFGLVFIMPLVGYFMTKGPLAAEIDTRWKGLDGVYSSVPQGTGSANQSWVDKAKSINQQCELHNKRANLALWEKQKSVMRFPSRVDADMKKIKLEYLQEPVAGQRGDIIQLKYGEDYPEELRNLWLLVDPLDDGKNFRESKARRKVSFAMADLHAANWLSWGESGPDFPKIWAAQEDIWLETELLSAIKRLNQPCNSQHEAFVRQIGKIIFFGGTKAAGDAGASAGQSSNSGPAMEGGIPGGGGGGYGSGGFAGGFGGGGSGSGSSGKSLIDISLGEEFTASIETTSGTTAGSGGGLTMESSSSPGASGAPGGAAKSDVKRYIDDDEKLPYKRRGFSITLVMDHRQVPHLLAELMNSPFPVEIVRVHQGIYGDGGTSSGGGRTSSSNPMAGGTGGFPGTSPSAGLLGAGGGGYQAESSISSEGSSLGASSSPGLSTGQPGSSSAVNAMADPNLATVAIVGVWTLYRPVAVDPNQAPSTGSAPANLTGTKPLEPTTPAADPNAPANPVEVSATDSPMEKPTGDKPAETEKPTSETPAADEAASPKPPANDKPSSDDKPDSTETPADKPAQSTTEPSDKPKPSDES